MIMIRTVSLLYSEETELLKTEGKSDKNVSLDSIDKKLEGKAKLGLSLGTVTGITFGFQATRIMELNAVVDIFDLGDFAGGMSVLFALLDLEAGDAVFPVTAGPAVVFKAGNNEKTDILGIIRIEYDFTDIPLNLYLEGGIGLKIIPDIKTAGEGALGVRYIF